MAVDPVRLVELRRALLDLHKALIDSERAVYERAHGPLTPAQLLEQLVGESEFSWLRPVSALIVRADELIGSARPAPVNRRRAAPPADQLGEDIARFLRETRTLLASDHAPEAFRHRYHAALQRDPDVVLKHGAVVQLMS
jgi:hypothetical protein